MGFRIQSSLGDRNISAQRCFRGGGGQRQRDRDREIRERGEEGRREGEGKRGRKEYTNRILICGPDRWAGTDNSPALASGITDM